MAIDYSRLTIPKPEPRKRVKARRKRVWQKARQAARAERYALDGGKCVRCGKPLRLNGTEPGATEFNTAHINEIVPRSLGGSAVDVNNLNTKCAGCHVGKGYHDHA